METFEPYRLPDPETHPATIAERLLNLPEHAHLREGDASIDWLMRAEPKIKGGRHVLGTAYMPRVNGELSELFDWMLERLLGRMPDFLIVLDLGYWETATPLQREILCYHELCHCVQKVDRYGAPRFTKEGLPVWGLRGHSVEEFTEVVARYGAWNDEIREFVAAVAAHDSSPPCFNEADRRR